MGVAAIYSTLSGTKTARAQLYLRHSVDEQDRECRVKRREGDDPFGAGGVENSPQAPAKRRQRLHVASHVVDFSQRRSEYEDSASQNKTDARLPKGLAVPIVGVCDAANQLDSDGLVDGAEVRRLQDLVSPAADTRLTAAMNAHRAVLSASIGRTVPRMARAKIADMCRRVKAAGGVIDSLHRP